MDILGRHRIAFNNISVQLFGDLERDLKLALRKGVEEKAELQKVINDQQKLLKEQELLLGAHEKTKVEQVETIAEQKKEIEKLKYELAKAVVENENLEETVTPRIKSDRGRKRIALGTPPRELMQDKENITFSPIFNYLTPNPQKHPTLERAISPPLKSPRKSTITPYLPTDCGVQTERLYQNDEAVQTDPISTPKDLTETYYELTIRHDALRNDIIRYKSAHQELQEKYLKNKKVWEAWVKVDKERLEQAKKRKRGGSAMSEGGDRKLHGHMTPISSVIGRTPYTKPPVISPNKPIVMPEVSYIIPRKVGLFAGFKTSTENIGSNDLGVDIGTSGTRDAKIETTISPLERSYLKPRSSNDKPLLSPHPGPKGFPITQKNSKGAQTPDLEDHIDSTTDSESNESRDNDATPTQMLYDRPPTTPPRPSPGPAFKIPKTKEKLDSKRTREGDSVVRPVVIKSEPSAASSEGFDYHIYEQESLDLDDIGYKPDTPRKRQKISSPPVEGPTSDVNSSSRPGWSNGGFMVKRALGVVETQDPAGVEDTHDDDEGIIWNNEEVSVPMLPSFAMNYEEVGGLIIDSQLRRPRTPPGVVSDIRNTDTMAEGRESQNTNNDTGSSPLLTEDPLIPRLKNPPSPTPIRRTLAAVEELVNLKANSGKPRTRHRVVPGTSIAQITEDGTDGIEDVHSDNSFGSQKMKPEGIPKLSEMLNTPTPKTPNLAHLRRKIQTPKSDPPKKVASKGSKNPGSISEPPKGKGRTDPIRNTMTKQKGRSKLDISHFRVNPNVNDGRDYAFSETVRNRAARKCLPGCVKSCCKGLSGFVEAAGLPSPAPRGPRWRSSSPPSPSHAARGQEGEEIPLDKQFTARFGKHRDAFARRKSPPGFWDADFPDTQDLEKQHEAAEEMRLQKVEEMRREAEKGGKGRYLYKG